MIQCLILLLPVTSTSIFKIYRSITWYKNKSDRRVRFWRGRIVIGPLCFSYYWCCLLKEITRSSSIHQVVVCSRHLSPSNFPPLAVLQTKTYESK